MSSRRNNNDDEDEVSTSLIEERDYLRLHDRLKDQYELSDER